MSDGWPTFGEWLQNLKEVYITGRTGRVVERSSGGSHTVFEGGAPYAFSDDDAGWEGDTREIHVGRPRDPENWQEHAPGHWHRKGS